MASSKRTQVKFDIDSLLQFPRIGSRSHGSFAYSYDTLDSMQRINIPKVSSHTDAYLRIDIQLDCYLATRNVQNS